MAKYSYNIRVFFCYTSYAHAVQADIPSSTSTW